MGVVWIFPWGTTTVVVSNVWSLFIVPSTVSGSCADAGHVAADVLKRIMENGEALLLTRKTLVASTDA